MICLIAGAPLFAAKWAKAQNLRADEWFAPVTVFDIYRKKNFHTLVVSEGIDLLSNDQLNRLLVAAWECGQRR